MTLSGKEFLKTYKSPNYTIELNTIKNKIISFSIRKDTLVKIKKKKEDTGQKKLFAKHIYIN